MKTTGRISLWLALMLGVCLLCPALASAGRVAFVSNPNPMDRLNLRTAPSQTAISLGKYYTGVSVDVLDESNGWAHVAIGNLEGYMSAQYLADSTAFSAIPTVKIANASGTGLNLRQEQSINSRSLGLYPNGTQVEVLGVGETWHHVRVNNQTGFMLATGLSPRLTFSDTTESGQSQASTYAVVNNPNPADRLNLRASASAQAATKGKYYNGTPVTLLETLQNGWYKVRVGSVTGYMDGRYLAIGQAASSVQSAMPTATIANASGTGLYLRVGQSTNTSNLGLYRNGTQVTVMGITQDWYHVMVDNLSGYMLADGLTPKLSFRLTD